MRLDNLEGFGEDLCGDALFLFHPGPRRFIHRLKYGNGRVIFHFLNRGDQRFFTGFPLGGIGVQCANGHPGHESRFLRFVQSAFRICTYQIKTRFLELPVWTI